MFLFTTRFLNASASGEETCGLTNRMTVVQSPAQRGPGSALVALHDGRLELRFVPPFSAADLAAVKAILGARWTPESSTWMLPATAESHSALRRSSGPRLVRLPPLTAHGDEGDRPADGVAHGEAVDPAAAAEDPGHPAADSGAPQPERPGGAGRTAASILARLRTTLRTREYSRKTERAYLAWTRRFLQFHGWSGDAPALPERRHAEAYLTHLATGERLAARSRNQAASALRFMFREVFRRDEMLDVARAKGPHRMPVVLSHREVLCVLRQLTGKYFLVVVLLYSSGLRLEECLRIRVKDIDFELRQVFIRDGKGQKDRYTPLAQRAVRLLQAQIRRVAELHAADRSSGGGWAPLPGALHRKDPNAGYELRWQFMFPATTINADPVTGRAGRWSLHATAVQRVVKRAVRQSGITKRATCHTFRHSYATEALRGGCDVRTLQHVMGHKDIRTTMIYLHVVEQTGLYLRSPLDRPDDPEDEDPIGSPGAGPGLEWELAARQWKATDRGKRQS
jgi:integron integrase